MADLHPAAPVVICFEPCGFDLGPTSTEQTFGTLFGQTFPNVDVCEITDLPRGMDVIEHLHQSEGTVPCAYFMDIPAFPDNRERFWDMAVALLQRHQDLSHEEDEPHIFLHRGAGTMHATRYIRRQTGYNVVELPVFKYEMCRFLASLDTTRKIELSDLQNAETYDSQQPPFDPEP